VYDPKADSIPTMKIADFGLTRSGSYTNNPHLSGAIGTFVTKNKTTTITEIPT